MKTQISNPTPAAVAKAVRLLKSGEVVAIPTETVYGLAANTLNPDAIAKIFAVKNRPPDNPLIVHVTDMNMAKTLSLDIPPLAGKLAKHFWPGALTMIFKKTGDIIPNIVSAGLDTAAVRVPAHPAALEIIRQCGFPIAAPSANLSGSPSPTSAKHVYDDLNGRIPLIIDGGECEIGLESTVIAFDADKIRMLRPGAVTAEQLREFAYVIIDNAVTGKCDGETAPSPGMLHKHYAPKSEVIAYKTPPFLLRRGDYIIREPDATALFANLREFDEIGAKRVYVRLPEPEGIGLALYNRIIRSADYNVVNTPRIFGLTGLSGAGKSAASGIFKNRGFFIINCDEFSKEVILSPKCQEEIRRGFPEMFDESGVFNRKKAAETVFSDKNKLLCYEQTVFPYVNFELIKIIARSPSEYVLLDAPTLYQAGEDDFCEAVIAISANVNICVDRVTKRDNISEKDAEARLISQKSADFFRKKADYIIENNGSFDEFAERINEVIDSIEQKNR